MKKGFTWEDLDKYSFSMKENLDLGKNPVYAISPDPGSEYPTDDPMDEGGQGATQLFRDKDPTPPNDDGPKKKRVPIYNFREWEILSWCIARINDYKNDKGNRKKLEDYNKAKEKWKEVQQGKYSKEGPAQEFPDFPRSSQDSPSRNISPGKLEATLPAFIGLIGGAFFLSSSITGNTISNLSTQTSSFIGIGLFLIGIFGALFYFRHRK